MPRANNWPRTTFFLAGILAGVIGAGGVTGVQISNLEAKVDSDHERLVRIETDVVWVKNYLARLQRFASRGRIDGSSTAGGY